MGGCGWLLLLILVNEEVRVHHCIYYYGNIANWYNETRLAEGYLDSMEGRKSHREYAASAPAAIIAYCCRAVST